MSSISVCSRHALVASGSPAWLHYSSDESQDKRRAAACRRGSTIMTTLTAPTGFRGAFRVDDDARAAYSEAAGIARAWPRGVAVPEDVDDLATLVDWAASTRTPLIPRGSGSSMPGGAVGDGVIVDLSR